MHLAGKVAVVTGGGKGIGAATTRLLASDGAAVMVAEIDEGAAQRIVRAVNDSGGRAAHVRTDVSLAEDVDGLIDETVRTFGGLDLLVNNAGLLSTKSTVDTTPDEWARILGVNLTGAWLCARAAIPVMARAGGGSIVNVASNAGLVGFANLAAYCASKGGLVQLTKAMALDCAKLHIRVNAVCPGHTRTPMAEGFVASQPDPQQFVDTFVDQAHPLGRMAEPDEIARAILFLASDHASFVTGAVLPVDGGYTAH